MVATDVASRGIGMMKCDSHISLSPTLYLTSLSYIITLFLSLLVSSRLIALCDNGTMLELSQPCG